jgi:hypothetical protein
MSALIHVTAVYLVKQKKFRVQVVAPKERWVELMDMAHFVKFAREDGPISVSGITLHFEGDNANETQDAVRTYLRQVADAFIAGVNRRQRDN